MTFIQINTIPMNMYLELYITVLFPQINIRGKNLPTFSVINISLKMNGKNRNIPPIEL